jgi:hypothetical protein
MQHIQPLDPDHKPQLEASVDPDRSGCASYGPATFRALTFH